MKLFSFTLVTTKCITYGIMCTLQASCQSFFVFYFYDLILKAQNKQHSEIFGAGAGQALSQSHTSVLSQIFTAVKAVKREARGNTDTPSF